MKEIGEILRKTFDLKDELYEKIKNCIENKPRIIKIKGKKFLVKGDSKETLKSKEKEKNMKDKANVIGEAGILLEKPLNDKEELKSLYKSLFYVLFSHYKEPLLLSSPSDYKSKIAKDISPEACAINFYPEISNSQLIGNVSLLVNRQAKEYYLEQICKICKREDKLMELKKELVDYINEKKKEVIQKKEKEIKRLKLLKRQKEKEENKENMKYDDLDNEEEKTIKKI